MSDRLFGFDTSELKVPRPDLKEIEAEMERTFGRFGFSTSRDFSLTNDR